MPATTFTSSTKTNRGGKGRKKKNPQTEEPRLEWLVTNDKKKVLAAPTYRYSCYGRETHGQQLYSLDVYQNSNENQPVIFATAGSNRVSIYEITSGDGDFKVVQCYEFPNKNEIFYTCAWSDDANGKPILAAAGKRGVIQVFEPTTPGPENNYGFLAHSNEINHLTFNPKQKHLLMSASKDRSIKLWNLRNGVLIAKFGGIEGHRDEVICVDFHMSSDRFLSCGMDHAIKIWRLDTKEIQITIQVADKWKADDKLRFKTRQIHYPDFTSREFHVNYVDCAKWMTDLVFSKSCDDEVIIWKPGDYYQKWEDIKPGSDEASLLTSLEVANLDIWFVKFSFNFMKDLLAVGNTEGKVYVFNLDTQDPDEIKAEILSHPNCTFPVRQTAFSPDGRVLLFTCDDGSLWRWNRKDLIMKKKETVHRLVEEEVNIVEMQMLETEKESRNSESDDETLNNVNSYISNLNLVETEKEPQKLESVENENEININEVEFAVADAEKVPLKPKDDLNTGEIELPLVEVESLSDCQDDTISFASMELDRELLLELEIIRSETDDNDDIEEPQISEGREAEPSDEPKLTIEQPEATLENDAISVPKEVKQVISEENNPNIESDPVVVILESKNIVVVDLEPNDPTSATHKSRPFDNDCVYLRQLRRIPEMVDLTEENEVKRGDENDKNIYDDDIICLE